MLLTLEQAQRLILGHLAKLPAEDVSLLESANRILASAIPAPSAVPAFARSAMDGYVVRSCDLKKGKQGVTFTITGEIAAGSTNLPGLGAGTTVRIMTGGAIPPGVNQVVPFEMCQVKGSQVTIDQPPCPGAFLRAKGTDLKKGQTIIRQGKAIAPQHLPLLAESGIDTLSVVKRPSVAIICTGSELLEPSIAPETGQIVSGNRFLLDALIRQTGARTMDHGLVADELPKIVTKLKEALAGPADIILTTGGMGPGKYDLLPRAFAELGINAPYQALAVRPGRSTMFGTAANKAIFALPGPPPAVFLLFHELVIPALRKLQGITPGLPALGQALLTEPIRMKKKGLLNLKGAVVKAEGASLTIRPARNLEPANAIIHVPANRRTLREGDTVRFRSLCE